MIKKFLLVIDQGTTSSRVVIYKNNFELYDFVQKEFKQYFPKDGWVEHNPIEIWNDIKNLINKILKKNKLTYKNIISIGITNQRETTVLWEKSSGKPIYRAIVWQDRRTSKYCLKLKKSNIKNKIRKTTGLEIDPYFSATKIKWILDNVKLAEINLKKNNLLFGTIDTWILWKLTNGKSHLTDITNASRTMLFDSQKEIWSENLLKIFGVPKKILPQVVENSHNFGKTNIFGGTIKIGGMAGDQQASTIGQACFSKGQSKSTYGTGCFMLMNIGNKFILSKNKLLTTVAFKINGEKMFCYEGSIFVAGSAIQWLRDNLRFLKKSNESDKLFKKSKANRLYFVPALTGLGAPYWNPNARGTIVGLTRDTKREDIVKAALESLSYQTYELIECMEKDSNIKISEIKVDGGMIDNKSFLQSLSDITQINIIRPKNIETTSLGVAYLAGIQAGIIKNTSDIKKLWKKKSVSVPKLKHKLAKSQIKKWKYIIKTINNLY